MRDNKHNSLHHENMLVYLSLDIICSSKFTVFLELCFLKSVRILELIMSTDKHQYIFLHQMEAIVYIISHYPRLSACGHFVRNDTMPLQTRASPPFERHKEMTEMNSCYYRILLLQKCGHFCALQHNISLAFSSHYNRHLLT